MAKGGLSNDLIGKKIVPREEFGSADGDSNDTNAHIWRNIKPNMTKQYVAFIDAAWVEDGSVKIAVHDPWGNTDEMWLKNVALAVD